MQTTAYKLSQRFTPIATAFFLALTPYSAMAEKDDHDHEIEQHSSHEHGVARLTVATTDDGLEIALESPAANVFGFEHAAKSEEEREAVHKALEKLKDGAMLFAVNTAAACSLENASVEAPSAEHHDDEHEQKETYDDHDNHKKEKHDDDEHEKEEKDDDHGHEKEKKHDDHDHEKEEKHDGHKDDDHDQEKKEKHDDHEDDDHADEESSHSDVEAVWGFHCEKPAAIETVNVKLFSAFPGGFEEIAVEWITAANAGKTELKEDGEVSLKP